MQVVESVQVALRQIKVGTYECYVIITDEMLQPCFHWDFVEKMC